MDMDGKKEVEVSFSPPKKWWRLVLSILLGAIWAGWVYFGPDKQRVANFLGQVREWAFGFNWRPIAIGATVLVLLCLWLPWFWQKHLCNRGPRSKRPPRPPFPWRKIGRWVRGATVVSFFGVFVLALGALNFEMWSNCKTPASVEIAVPEGTVYVDTSRVIHGEFLAVKSNGDKVKVEFSEGFGWFFHPDTLALKEGANLVLLEPSLDATVILSVLFSVISLVGAVFCGWAACQVQFR